MTKLVEGIFSYMCRKPITVDSAKTSCGSSGRAWSTASRQFSSSLATSAFSSSASSSSSWPIGSTDRLTATDDASLVRYMDSDPISMVTVEGLRALLGSPKKYLRIDDCWSWRMYASSRSTHPPDLASLTTAMDDWK